MIQLMSFAYKNGAPDGFVVIDCRDIMNPHYVPKLRPLTGRDEAVLDYVRADALALEVLGRAIELTELGKSRLAFGCYGGRHRSVAMVELLRRFLVEQGNKVVVAHRELD